MQPKTPEKPRSSFEIPEILEELLRGERPANWRERLGRDRTRIVEGATEARISLTERIEKALEENGIGKDVRQALEGLVAEIRSFASSDETKGIFRNVGERWRTAMNALARWSRLGTEAIEKSLPKKSPFGKFFSYLGLAGLSFLRGFSLFFGGKEEEPPKMPDDFEGPLPGPREETPSGEVPKAEEEMPEPDTERMPKPEKPAPGRSAAWDGILADGRITDQEGQQFLKNPALKRELLSSPQAEQDRILTLMIQGDASGEFRKKLEKASSHWDGFFHGSVVEALAKEGLTESEGEKLVAAYRRLKAARKI